MGGPLIALAMPFRGLPAWAQALFWVEFVVVLAVGLWTTVLFVQLFWMEQKLRGKDYGTRLIRAIEDEARRFGATRSYLDTMSFQAPGFYRACGYEEFGSIEGYPGGVTRHWFTKAL